MALGASVPFSVMDRQRSPQRDGAFASARPPSVGRGHPLAFFAFLMLLTAGSVYSALAIMMRVDGVFAPGNELRLPGRFARLPGLNVSTVEGAAATERINILVLGVDRRPLRDAAADGPPRSDSMYVISLDPLQKSATVLAIPRDLYVEVPNPRSAPGFWDTRINTAMHYGAMYNYPGGGPALARRTVEHTFKIPITYYAVIDWVAFADIIDALGGVEIAVPETLRGVEAFNVRDGNAFPITIRAGRQPMDSITALAYSRFRDDEAGDFGRVQRQQQVITAAMEKALALGWLGRTPALYSRFRGAVDTDMSAVRLPGIAALLRQIGVGNVQMVALAGPEGESVARRITPDGEDVLVPIWSKVGQTLAAALPDRRLTDEAATIKLVNGTGARDFATLVAGYLARYGMPKSSLLAADAERVERRRQTSITLYAEKEWTARRIAEILELPVSAIVRSDDPARPAGEPDIVVTLGADVRLPDDGRYDGFIPR